MLSPLTLQKSAQVGMLMLFGGGFGYWARRWDLRRRLASEVEGTEDVKSFEQRVRRVSMTPALWKKIVKGWNALDEKVNSHGSK